jgi:spermidine synthase
VLSDPKVVVHINDGRQHLQMQAPGSYDLVVLEPPPIAYAGVSALYSREFYALARTRLKPNGYISQWLPAYQVPSETALAMVRAFVDVFPQSGCSLVPNPTCCCSARTAIASKSTLSV